MKFFDRFFKKKEKPEPQVNKRQLQTKQKDGTWLDVDSKEKKGTYRVVCFWSNGNITFEES